VIVAVVVIPDVGVASCKLFLDWPGGASKCRRRPCKAEWLRAIRVGPGDKLVPGSRRLVVTGAAAPTQIRFGPEGDLYYLSITGALHRVHSVRR
jgi:hypothetical protein